MNDEARVEGKRPLLVARGWVQVTVLVFLVGFFVLGLMGYRVYTDGPPVPEEVVDPNGQVVFTGDDVRAGQAVFLRNGLMSYGSVFGHGAYLGPDFTADYLRRAADHVLERYGETPAGAERTAREFKENRYDARTGRLSISAAQASAFESLCDHYGAFFGEPTTRHGLRRAAITDRVQIRQLTAFFAWTAWAASTLRPGRPYSYTNNWPPEPRVGNQPTAAMLVWSMLSLVALLGGIGLLFAAYGRWSDRLGWRARERQRLAFREEVELTPAQRATAWFFLAMAGLFLVQTLLGGATQHYRAELTGFFGLDLARVLPFNLARTWHLQLAIFWVATSYLAAGIFIAPLVARHEPRGQHVLAFVLLGALVVVVAGSMLGELAGIHGWTESAWLGNQGFEYLELGRLWQALLVIGLGFWVAILYRALASRLRGDHVGNMPWLFFFSALAIPAFYAVGLLVRQDASFTANDFWRFWVVHLWVEDFLEIFTTVVVAYMFVLLGVVAERVAMVVVYLHVILYSVGGVIGTMHHVYFSGAPVEHMALGAFFSAAEVLPLTFLTVEAWSFLRLGAVKNGVRGPFLHRWAVMSLVAVGFWNFLGAGVFGFLINLPIVSYYEIGTALTSNHGHASMMGVYGMLAVGLALFALRYLVRRDQWSDRLAALVFWSLNVGLAWMVFATLFPLGLLQLYAAVQEGYVEARALASSPSELRTLVEWLRLPGDAVFIAGGAVPLLLLAYRAVRRPSALTSRDLPAVLFTEPEPGAASGPDEAPSSAEPPTSTSRP